MSLLPSRGPETSTRQDGEFEVVGVDEDVAPVLDALASETAREVLNAIYEDPGTPSEIAGRLDMSIQKVAYHLEKLEDVDLIAVAGSRYSEKGQEMTVYEPPEDPLVLFVGTEERKSRLRSLVRRVVPTIGVLAFGSLLIQRLFGTSNSLLPFDAGPDGMGAGSGDQSSNGYTTSGDDGGGGGNGAAGGANGAGNGVDDGESPDAMGIETEAAPETDAPSIAQEATPTAEPAAEQRVTPSIDTTGNGSETVELSDSGARVTDDAVRVVAETADPGLEPGIAFFVGGVFALTVVAGWWYYRSQRR